MCFKNSFLSFGHNVLRCIILVSFIFIALSPSAYANKKYASLVMDADTGKILSQSNADKMLHPASLTKVMTLLMVFDALDSGQLKLNDRIYMSRNAASMVPSKLNIPAGGSIRVKDAIYALVTKSANDVAVAIAEKLGKTESRFALLMTKKARSLGMNRTRFMNASGLHHPKQVTTARDMAKMGRYLIAIQPRHYKYFNTQRFTYRGKTYRNHNRLLGEYNGLDGIKTGYIQASGFNLLASAKRNDKRLIGVVFGGRTSKTRNAHMKEILDIGFRKISNTRDIRIVKQLPVRNPRRIEVAAKQPEPMAAPTTSDLNTSELTKTLLAAEEKNITIDKAAKLQQQRNSRYQEQNKRYEIAYTTQSKHLFAANDSSLKQQEEMVTKFLKPKPLNGSPSETIKKDLGNWGIQIGAFVDRNTASRILDNGHKKLPTTLQYANSKIAPIQGRKGLIYRAWLTGFSQTDAKSACNYYDDCLVIKTN